MTKTTTRRRTSATARGLNIVAEQIAKGHWMAWDLDNSARNTLEIRQQDSGWWKVMGIGDVASQSTSLAKALDLVAGYYVTQDKIKAGQRQDTKERGPMTLTLTIQAGDIIAAAQQGQRVAWAMEDGSVLRGTARSLGDEQGYFQRGTEDIRDLYLRTTLETGFDRFDKVSDLIAKLHITFFTNA